MAVGNQEDTNWKVCATKRTGSHCAKRLGSNEEWVYNPWIRSYFVHIAEAQDERGYFSFFRFREVFRFKFENFIP